MRFTRRLENYAEYAFTVALLYGPAVFLIGASIRNQTVNGSLDPALEKEIQNALRKWQNSLAYLASFRRPRMSGTRWEVRRTLVFLRDHFMCQYCGTRSDTLHCDHRHPYSRGGSDDFSNLVAACPRCNLRKHNKTAREFRSYLDLSSQERSHNLKQLRYCCRLLREYALSVTGDTVSTM